MEAAMAVNSFYSGDKKAYYFGFGI